VAAVRREDQVDRAVGEPEPSDQLQAAPGDLAGRVVRQDGGGARVVVPPVVSRVVADLRVGLRREELAAHHRHAHLDPLADVRLGDDRAQAQGVGMTEVRRSHGRREPPEPLTARLQLVAVHGLGDHLAFVPVVEVEKALGIVRDQRRGQFEAQLPGHFELVRLARRAVDDRPGGGDLEAPQAVPQALGHDAALLLDVVAGDGPGMGHRIPGAAVPDRGQLVEHETAPATAERPDGRAVSRMADLQRGVGGELRGIEDGDVRPGERLHDPFGVLVSAGGQYEDHQRGSGRGREVAAPPAAHSLLSPEVCEWSPWITMTWLFAPPLTWSNCPSSSSAPRAAMLSRLVRPHG
jgi:hypothetical protein